MTSSSGRTRWVLTLAFGLQAAIIPLPPALAADGSAWASTKGGGGGKIVRVTTLSPTGTGSLLEALETRGPRIIVFEVGGVIDLGRRNLPVREPFVTIAGQTAPSPGITLVRGGITVATNDVIISHLRIRPGEAGMTKRSGWEVDGIATQAGARDVIVDHCSLSWATDENLSASGPRFAGNTPDDWRNGTSHRITFSNNIIADGLAHATHAKGEHSKGVLIHDNATGIALVGNLFANNVERNPLFKGGARGVVVNNLIYNPGPRAAHYNLILEEWGERTPQIGSMALIGNVLRAGPSTPPDVALFSFGGSGDIELFLADNIAVDRLGRPLAETGRYSTARAAIVRVKQAPVLPAGLAPMPAAAVQDFVVRNAGARPWDRDATDRRIVADVIEGRGSMIDSEQDAEGYPSLAPTRQAFDEAAWDLRTMEKRQGSN
jgi:pectate lyase